MWIILSYNYDKSRICNVERCVRSRNVDVRKDDEPRSGRARLFEAVCQPRNFCGPFTRERQSIPRSYISKTRLGKPRFGAGPDEKNRERDERNDLGWMEIANEPSRFRGKSRSRIMCIDRVGGRSIVWPVDPLLSKSKLAIPIDGRASCHELKLQNTRVKTREIRSEWFSRISLESLLELDWFSIFFTHAFCNLQFFVCLHVWGNNLFIIIISKELERTFQNTKVLKCVEAFSEKRLRKRGDLKEFEMNPRV